jgi:hypothetical protein
MDIQSLLCPLSSQSLIVDPPTVITADIYSKTDDAKTYHERQSSFTSFPDSPTSASSTSSFYSIPSSPEIDTLPSSLSSNTLSENHHLNQTQIQSHSARASNSRTISGHSHTRTPWSAEEDELLQQGYSQDMSWAMVSTIYLPHRSRGCCWGRFKTLQAKALEQREWTDSEDRLLQTAIKKNARLFKQAWKAVSQEMSNRSWRECELRSTKVTPTTIRKKQQTRST